MDENSMETVCEAIYTLIPEVQCLRELYQSWYVLSCEARERLDMQVNDCFRPERASLYLPLKEALKRWDIIQNTQGAPGCDTGLVSFSCNPQLEAELLNVIYAVQNLIEKVRDLKKRKIVHKNYIANELSRLATPKDKLRTTHNHKHLGPLTLHRSQSADDLSGYKGD